jgi:FkbM family methyltransferase
MGRIRDTAKRVLAMSRLLGISTTAKILLMQAWPGKQRGAATCIQLDGFPAGFWIRPQGSDLDVVLQIFFARDYDLSWCMPYKLHMQKICDRIREEGNIPLIIDAGANIGASTLWFAHNFPDCKIFAVEPDRGNFAVLKKNVEAHPNITLFNAGLWDKSTNLSIISETDNSWGRRVEEEIGSKTVVPSVTIPDLLANDKRVRPIIVKIDIEGAETALFRSNTEWVDDIPLLIFEPHDNLWHWLGTWQGAGHAFFSALSRQKHEYLFRGENVFAFLHPDPVGPCEGQPPQTVAAV